MAVAKWSGRRYGLRDANHDGWYPFMQDVHVPLGSPEQFAAYATQVKQHAQEAGRDLASLDFTYDPKWYNEEEAERLPDGERHLETYSR
jgi:hypothetical protein